MCKEVGGYLTRCARIAASIALNDESWVTQSVSQSVTDQCRYRAAGADKNDAKLTHGFVKIDAWISLSCYMDLSTLMHWFLEGVKWILLLCAFVKVVMWICQSCSFYFSPFAKQNQAEVWPSFQSLLKLLLLIRGVEWVKVLNSLNLLCLWQCLWWTLRNVGANIIFISAIQTNLSK